MSKSIKPIEERDSEAVNAYMKALKHPLKDEIEKLRLIIKKVDPGIKERIKWNAPSYYCGKEDFVTFNHRAQEHVHLVFHHPCIESIKSDLLEGEHKGRRMAYFKDLKEIKKQEKELVSVIKEILVEISH